MRVLQSEQMMTSMTMEKRKKRPIPRTTPREWTDRLSLDEIRRAIPMISTDDRSRDSDACSDLSVGTPSSVFINGYSMSRDLSDLSGSYMNGNTAPRSALHHSPSDPSSHNSHQRTWRQAHILSSREPLHPQPPSDCDDSVRMDHGKALLVMDQNDMIEIIKQVDGDDRTLCSECTFLPIIILLMDPDQKIYELMQLWIDVKHDTVRDILHSIQSNLGERWRQDYDGIFNLRNNHFSALIHIVDVSKYDAQPFEVWVAKPWSMSAQNTVAYASVALNHLKHLGVFKATDDSRSDPIRKGEESSNNKLSTSTKESYLFLSHEAQSRIYVMGGLFKHHHACQFLSFSPTFESAVEVVRVDVLGAARSSDEASCVSVDIPLAAVFTEKHEPTRAQTPERVEKTQKSDNFLRTPETIVCDSPDRPTEEKVASEQGSIEDFDMDEPIRKFSHHRRRRRFKELVGLLKCKPCRMDQDMEGSQRTLWLSTDQTSTAFRGSSTDRPLWESAWDFYGNESIVSETEPLLLKNSSDLSYQLEMYRYEI